jgi:hypothetical protein
MKILVVDHHVLIRGDITVLEAADSRQAMEIVAAPSMPISSSFCSI